MSFDPHRLKQLNVTKYNRQNMHWHWMRVLTKILIFTAFVITQKQNASKNSNKLNCERVVNSIELLLSFSMCIKSSLLSFIFRVQFVDLEYSTMKRMTNRIFFILFYTTDKVHIRRLHTQSFWAIFDNLFWYLKSAIRWLHLLAWLVVAI